MSFSDFFHYLWPHITLTVHIVKKYYFRMLFNIGNKKFLVIKKFNLLLIWGLNNSTYSASKGNHHHHLSQQSTLNGEHSAGLTRKSNSVVHNAALFFALKTSRSAPRFELDTFFTSL